MPSTLELIKKQLEEIAELRNLPDEYQQKFKVWHQITKAIIQKRLGENELKEFNDINYSSFSLVEDSPDEKKADFDEGLNSAEAFLTGLIKQIELFGEPKISPYVPFIKNSKNEKKAKVSNGGVHLTINNAQSNQQTVNITATFEQVINMIEEVDATSEKKMRLKKKSMISSKN